MYAKWPAAFRRLCVETNLSRNNKKLDLTAAFRRLCVETRIATRRLQGTGQPPSGGCVLKHRLHLAHYWDALQPPSGGCVLKLVGNGDMIILLISRLQAAVC